MKYLTPIFFLRTSFLHGETLVSSVQNFTTTSTIDDGIASLPPFLSNFVHCSSRVLSFRSCLRFAPRSKALLFNPTHLDAAFKQSESCREITAASITLRATRLSLPCPYLSLAQASANQVHTTLQSSSSLWFCTNSGRTSLSTGCSNSLLRKTL
jgi:hypothetical protein